MVHAPIIRDDIMQQGGVAELCCIVCIRRRIGTACTVHRREVTPMEKLECDRAGSLELPSSASQPPVCLKPGSHVLETRSLKKLRSCMHTEGNISL